MTKASLKRCHTVWLHSHYILEIRNLLNSEEISDARSQSVGGRVDVGVQHRDLILTELFFILTELKLISVSWLWQGSTVLQHIISGTNQRKDTWDPSVSFSLFFFLNF